MELRVEIDPSSLRGTNAAVDIDASWLRYRDELVESLQKEFPAARIEVVRASKTRVHGVDDATALRVEGIARAVRHCANWVVYEE